MLRPEHFLLISWNVIMAAMMLVLLLFDQTRGKALKDWLAGFWPTDRRRVLHLEKNNGFYFFVDRLIDWSESFIRFAWVAALPTLIAGLNGLVVGAFFLALCFCIRSGTLTFLGASRVKKFSMPFDLDAYGVFGRTRAHWQSFYENERRHLAVSSMACIGILLARAVL
jgi:hypothetical protein